MNAYAHVSPSRIKRHKRRGFILVVSMSVLVILGSLAVAAAIMSQGNLRTAATQVQVTSALSAAEAGMQLAESRLSEAARRFVVQPGSINGAFGTALWDGTYTSQDAVSVTPNEKFSESSLPRGIAEALVSIHSHDQNALDVEGLPAQTSLTNSPLEKLPEELRDENWVRTPALQIAGDDSLTNPAFSIAYAPLTDGSGVRVFVTGYGTVEEYQSNGSVTTKTVTRTISRDYHVTKRNEFAIISNPRLQLGRNVSVVGDVGVRYTDVSQINGDPIVMRSDFFGLDPALDRKLEDFYNGVRQYDQDGDNRLRVSHSVESQGLPPDSRDYDGDDRGDNAFADITGTGYIDEFSVFLTHYAAESGSVVGPAVVTPASPSASQEANFAADLDLFLLVDQAVPDRNRNGVSGFEDENHNNRLDAGETFLDRDPLTGVYSDVQAGWADGELDRYDGYNKVRGTVYLRSGFGAWESARGQGIHSLIRGSIRPATGRPAIVFGASGSVLPDLSLSTFTSNDAQFRALADGLPFEQQVAAQIGTSAAQLSAYDPRSAAAGTPRYFDESQPNSLYRELTGHNGTEPVPFQGPTVVDYYKRPRFENMVFHDVVIPKGLNALFVNCTFVGVTFVDTTADNVHDNWGLYGRATLNAATGEPEVNRVPLDKSDFPRFTTGRVQDGPVNYDEFADPLVVNGQVLLGDDRDTKELSNNVRFHDCTVVGSIVTATPKVFSHSRNKLQFTGSTSFSESHPVEPSNAELNPRTEQLDFIRRTSLMAPNFSVEIGQFNAVTEHWALSGNPGRAQNIHLQGTLVAGVMDIRGNADIDGSLILTFNPVRGQAPLVNMGRPAGNPASFNATIGYFGAENGDRESVEPSLMPRVGTTLIAGWDLDGDGLIDVTSDQSLSSSQQSAAIPVPFHGFGRVSVHAQPERALPDGIGLPLSVVSVKGSYREGSN